MNAVSMKIEDCAGVGGRGGVVCERGGKGKILQACQLTRMTYKSSLILNPYVINCDIFIKLKFFVYLRIGICGRGWTSPCVLWGVVYGVVVSSVICGWLGRQARLQACLVSITNHTYCPVFLCVFNNTLECSCVFLITCLSIIFILIFM